MTGTTGVIQTQDQTTRLQYASSPFLWTVDNMASSKVGPFLQVITMLTKRTIVRIREKKLVDVVCVLEIAHLPSPCLVVGLLAKRSGS